MGLVALDQKYTGTTTTSEQFNTAGRSVKVGLTAAVIVSQWTWAATLLQSSNVAWGFGVSGPFWYGLKPSLIPRVRLYTHTYDHQVTPFFPMLQHQVRVWRYHPGPSVRNPSDPVEEEG